MINFAYERRRALRPIGLGGVSAAALLLALAAQSPATAAQAAPAAPAPDAGQVEQIVVTGSLIRQDGFTAPTPTTVMSTADIQAAAPTNIADFVNTLPSAASTMTPAINNGMTSGGTAGQNFLNLRGLGTSRTLILLDGHRVVPTATNGASDINNIPSELIRSIDIVTGGASATYGSDAVAGVVNFVLDTKFKGIKGEAQYGISSRDDNPTMKVSLTYGGEFAGGRLHVLASVQGSNQQGIRYMDRSKREWNTGLRRLPNPAFVSQTATPNIPALLTFDNVNNSLAAPGGLITSGPARGIQFGAGGTPMPFQFGSPIIGSFMVGGQYGDDADETTFLSKVKNRTVFTRAAYDFTDKITGYAQFNYGWSLGDGWGAPQRHFGNINIKSDNAFLPASIRNLACPTAAANVNCFVFGSDVFDLGGGHNIDTRETLIGTVGLRGELFKNWNFDVYYQYGRSNVDLKLANNQINRNFDNAVDAVIGPNGQIMCRSTLTNPANGCQPLNLFGTGVASFDAKNYVLGTAHQQNRLNQQVAEATVNGDLINLWAGPLSIAGGVGYRKEDTDTLFTDPQALAGVFFAANYKPTVGSYNVKEIFGEALVPLLRDLPAFQKLDLDLAARHTDYSTSGAVTTYKLGVNYRPIQDILVRATRSRDIRAPNLSELYSGGTTALSPATDPLNRNISGSVPSATIGNKLLVPEIAQSFGAGVVYQPSWLRGFSASADYYHIEVKDAIANIGVQQEINLCASGQRPDICPLITRGPGVFGGQQLPNALLNVISGPVNIASVDTSGLDLEFGYRKNLAEWFDGWDAVLTVRVLGTHIYRYVSDNGLGIKHDSAGENGGSLPNWRWRSSLDYQSDLFNFNLVWRRISDGVFSNSFFDSSSGPLTVDNNVIKGADYFDLTVSKDFKILGSDSQFYVRVDNLFDKDPPPAPVTASFLFTQYNPSLYDGIGRYFRFGFRFMH